MVFGLGGAGVDHVEGEILSLCDGEDGRCARVGLGGRQSRPGKGDRRRRTL